MVSILRPRGFTPQKPRGFFFSREEDNLEGLSYAGQTPAVNYLRVRKPRVS